MQVSTPSRVLICDDQSLIRDTLAMYLESVGFVCATASDGKQCLDKAQELAPDAIVLDLAMPIVDGLGVLRQLRARGDDTPVVMLTGHGGVDSAIQATKLGAGGYLQKPLDVREVELVVRRVLEHAQLSRRVDALRSSNRGRYGSFVGRSAALAPVFETLDKIQDVAAPTVLILGESGTGKDVVARAIHDRGPRKDEVFVEVDCPSLPETLLESELFGHERGAFTDARQTKRGLFEVAGNGSVFLDEIGDLAPGSQAKLLRALQNRRFKRVGGVASLDLRAGVIAATNRNLKAEAEAGRFREDLYYRLDVVTLRVPPLRERRDDIPLLVAHFLDKLNQRFKREITGVAPDAMARLIAYPWPGNVRELRNVLERIAILNPCTTIDLDALPPAIRYPPTERPPVARPTGGRWELPQEGLDLTELERDLIRQALERTGGNRAAAGRLLGLSRYQVRTRIQRHDLGPEF